MRLYMEFMQYDKDSTKTLIDPDTLAVRILDMDDTLVESPTVVYVSTGLYYVDTSLSINYVSGTNYQLERTWTIDGETIVKTRRFAYAIGNAVLPAADTEHMRRYHERPLTAMDVTRKDTPSTGRVNRS